MFFTKLRFANKYIIPNVPNPHVISPYENTVITYSRLIHGKYKINDRVFSIDVPCESKRQHVIQTMIHTKPYSIGPTYKIYNEYTNNSQAHVMPLYSILNYRICVEYDNVKYAIVLYDNSVISIVKDSQLINQHIAFDL